MAKYVTLKTKVKLIVRRGAPGPISTAPDPSFDSITLDPAAAPPASPVQGQAWFDQDEVTWTLRQNGTDLQIGQETQANVRGDSGDTIADGTPSMFKGSVGASGRITVEEMDGSDITNARRLFGLATEPILQAGDGKITNFGKIRGIDTSGALYGETWADGEIIWISDTTIGALTNVEPARNKIGMPVAVVVYAHASAGTLFVRITSIDEHLLVTPDQRDALDNANLPTALNPIATIADAIDNDALLYMMRVIADGGTVEDPVFLDSFFKDAKANNYFDDIVAAYSPSWGVKGTTTASNLYSIIGSAQDIAQATAANQPTILSNDLNGKSRILLDGVDDDIGNLIFSWPVGPRTIVMGGFEHLTSQDNDRFINDASGATRILVTTTPDIGIASTTVTASNTNAPLNTPLHIQALFDGASSSFKINNTNESTGDAGIVQGLGIRLGSSEFGFSRSNYKDGFTVLLNSANDANFTTKMTALYNFSKLAYGTA